MAEPLSAHEVSRLVPGATETETAALVEWYAALQRAVAAFPPQDLHGVEPPLRSVPGPHV